MRHGYLHHNNIDALAYLDTSAEQHALITQAFELAKLQITSALEHDDLLGENESFCIFSDLDETLLDNSEYNAWLARYGCNFDEKKTWAAYCRDKRSGANPGAKAFLDFVSSQRDKRGRPIQIFYVTSRLNGDDNGGVRTATMANLQELEFPLPDGSDDIHTTHLFMKGLSVPPDGQSDKHSHYAWVQSHHNVKPILWLGDNCSDFAEEYDSSTPHQKRWECAVKEDGWGKRYIAFPNPVYGSFLRSLRDPANGEHLPDDHATQMSGWAQVRHACDPHSTPKMRALNVWPYDPDDAPE